MSTKGQTMKRRQNKDPLLAHVQNYFESYLRQVRGASPHTVRAYGNSLRLFFLFLAKRKKSRVENLRIDDIQAEHVLAFLAHVESYRGNQAATRNCRLAAIRSFVAHLIRHDTISRAEQYQRILAIPSKRAPRRSATYLEPEEVQQIIHQIDGTERNATRDRALLLFLYNTGARISEALAVRPRDLHLNRPRQVRLVGKGNKERYCPLWTETATSLRQLTLSPNSNDQPIFLNSRGQPITRDGAAHIISKYVRRAADGDSLLQKKRVTPHILRHSCAVALLQSGVDLTVIRDYLGHASISTTNHYVASNFLMKKKVLQAFWQRAGLQSQGRSAWRPSADLLEFLKEL
jgi:site-specific recombinase XerD